MNALLDTNVIVALGSPAESVPDLSGFDRLYASALTWAEMTKGLHTPTSISVYKQRRARFDEARAALGVGIPFDDDCMSAYDRILQCISEADGAVRAHTFDRMIAATALAHDLTVITRDRAGFAGLDGLVRVEVR